MVLSVWDSPAGAAAVALMRSAMSNEWTARLMREFVVTQVLRRAVAELGIDPAEAPTAGRPGGDADRRAGRGPLRPQGRAGGVSAEPETLVAAIGPNVQRFLIERPARRLL